MAQCGICGRSVPGGAATCPACSLDPTPPPGGEEGGGPGEGAPGTRLALTPASLRWVAHLTLWPGAALLALAFFASPSSRWGGLLLLGAALAAFGLMWLVAVRTVRALQERALGGAPPAPPPHQEDDPRLRRMPRDRRP